MHIHLNKLTVSALLTVAVTSLFWHLGERVVHTAWDSGFGSGDHPQSAQLSSAAKSNALASFDTRWSFVFRSPGSFDMAAKLGGNEFGGYEPGTTFGGYNQRPMKSPRPTSKPGKQGQGMGVAPATRNGVTYSYDTWSPDVTWGDDSWSSEIITGDGARRRNPPSRRTAS